MGESEVNRVLIGVGLVGAVVAALMIAYRVLPFRVWVSMWLVVLAFTVAAAGELLIVVAAFALAVISIYKSPGRFDWGGAGTMQGVVSGWTREKNIQVHAYEGAALLGAYVALVAGRAALDDWSGSVHLVLRTLIVLVGVLLVLLPVREALGRTLLHPDAVARHYAREEAKHQARADAVKVRNEERRLRERGDVRDSWRRPPT